MQKVKVKLSAEQHQVLCGILLGDANLQTENNGRTYRLRVTQAAANKEYLFHLYKIFKVFVTTPPRLDTFFDERTKKHYQRWVFSTTQQSVFRFYGQQFYLCNRKVVPKRIGKCLSPRSLAYWYMDDGAQKWKGRSLGVRLCTDSFTDKEVKDLAKLLTDKYHLITSTEKKGKGLRIYISSHSYERLRLVIYNYLVPCMVYKFPTPLPRKKTLDPLIEGIGEV